MKRRFWTLHPPGEDQGTWEAEVTGCWARRGVEHPDVLEKKFVERYRLNVPTFNKLAETLNNPLKKEDMRSAISPLRD